MKKFLILILMCICTCQSVYAVKAVSGTVTVMQPDGSRINVLIHGDEFFNYYTTADGYTIAKKSDGYYYYANYNTGALAISSVRVGSNTKSATMVKGVPQDVILMRRNSAMERFNAKMMRATGGKSHPQKVLVILAEYPDIKFVTPNPQAAFSSMLNAKGYRDHGATGSAADYYEDNSMGRYRPEFVVSNVVTLPQPRIKYGELSGDDKAAITQTIDACEQASKTGVNFADFDSDNDGEVDIVLIYYAGHNAAEGVPEAVWPHRWAVYTTNLVLNGKRIYNYACSSELNGSSGTNMTGMGTMCHEFAHVLGLRDMYDTENGVSAAMWYSLSLMDGGNYNNCGRTPPYLMAHERNMLGWLEFDTIESNGTFTLPDISTNKAYQISTDNPGEYFVLENRQSSGWDKYISGGSDQGQNEEPVPEGMLILHVDQSENNVEGISAKNRWLWNIVNTVPEHQCMDLVEACNHERRNTTPVAAVFYPGTTKNVEWNEKTAPNNQAWNKIGVAVNLNNIMLENNIVKFNASVEKNDITKAHVTVKILDFKGLPMQDVTVSLYETTKPQSSFSGVFLKKTFSQIRTKAAPVCEAITNYAGELTLKNVNPATYIFEIKHRGYKTYSIVKTLGAGFQQFAFALEPEADNPELSALKWHNNNNGFPIGLSDNTPLLVAVRFTAEDMKYYKKNKIDNISVSLVSPATVNMSVLQDDKTLVTKTITTNQSGNLIFDLSNQLIVKNSNDLAVMMEFRNYNLEEGALMIDDSTPTIDGKGNLVSLDGGISWYPLSAFGFDGNYVMTVNLAEVQVANNVTIAANQTEAYMKWESKINEIKKWVVKWKADDEADYKRIEVDTMRVLMENLQINKHYQVLIGAVLTAGKEPDIWDKSEFSTEVVSAPFPALVLGKMQYVVADELLLAVKNATADIKNIVYKVNDKVITDRLYKFEAAGAYIITAEINYASGDIEIIKRKINVIEK